MSDASDNPGRGRAEASDDRPRDHGAASSDPPRAAPSKRMIATTVLAALWTAAPPLLAIVMLAKIGPFSEWLRHDHGSGLAIFITVFMLAAGLGLLPTYSQAILGGWAFGFTTGYLGSLVGFVGGALLGRAIAKLCAGHAIEQWLDSKPKARIIRRAFVECGFWRSLLIVTLIRLNSPFSLTNLAMTASGVRLAPYLLGTAIGLSPRTALACWLAAQGAAQAKDFQSLVEDKGWMTLGVGIALLVVGFGVIGLIGKKALDRAMRSSPVPSSPHV